MASTLVGHSMTVNLAEGIYCEGSDSEMRTLVATASVDSTMKIWERKTSSGWYGIGSQFQQINNFANCLNKGSDHNFTIFFQP